MFRRSFLRPEAWVPLVAGLAWLHSASDAGWVAYLVAAIPGVLLVAAGGVSALWPIQTDAYRHGALAAVLGILLAPFSIAWAGFLPAFGLLVVSAGAFVSFGSLSTRALEPLENVPPPRPGLGFATAVAADEAFLWVINAVTTRRPHVPHQHEIEAMRGLERDSGWLDSPGAYHVVPPDLDHPRLERKTFRGTAYEHMSFESGYEPREEEPGRDRWLSFERNRTAHAWIVRNGAPERPWLVCLHGLGMGHPVIDFAAFPPDLFHRRLGLNLVYPILPFHGPRRRTAISGEGLFSRNIIDTVHACAQIGWDLRRILSWIRAEGGNRIGVYGLSLGGFSTSLLASLEGDLSCAIAGIPAANLPLLLTSHAPPPIVREMEQEGLTPEVVEEILRPVSPLHLGPKISRERRYIFAATGDRIVLPEAVRDLWVAWEEPRTLWYQGSHMSVLLHEDVRQFLRDALGESGLAESRGERAVA